MGIIKLFLCAALLLLTSTGALAGQYEIKKISDSVYAALAKPDGKVASNAFFVVTEFEVVLAGAHFIREGVSDLLQEIAKITPLPVQQVILTHHHKGYNFIDFDLPERSEVIVSANIWQSLKSETREFKNPTVVFENALTLNKGRASLIIIDAGPGHSAGDIIVYMPKEGILFASDLLFNDSFGFMGDASIHGWGESLELMERLAPSIVVPGVGKVSDGALIPRFKSFYQAFMTEVIRNVDKGNTLAQTKREFNLNQYKQFPGYEVFLNVNLERAYKEYKSSR